MIVCYKNYKFIFSLEMAGSRIHKLPFGEIETRGVFKQKHAYHWAFPTSSIVVCTKIAEILQDACDALDVESIYIAGEFPGGISDTLLEDALAHTREVVFEDYPDEFTFHVLCRALKRRDCLIETLDAFRFENTDGCRLLTDALACNTSVSSVSCFVIGMNRIAKTFFACCVASPTIEHVFLKSFNRVHPCDNWDDILALPALRRITLSGTEPVASVEVKRAWPQMVVRSGRSRVGCPVFEFAKTPDAMIPLDVRRKMRALYECAGKILPDHVIADIVADQLY